jgi:hypothetical protein
MEPKTALPAALSAVEVERLAALSREPLAARVVRVEEPAEEQQGSAQAGALLAQLASPRSAQELRAEALSLPWELPLRHLRATCPACGQSPSSAGQHQISALLVPRRSQRFARDSKRE